MNKRISFCFWVVLLGAIGLANPTGAQPSETATPEPEPVINSGLAAMPPRVARGTPAQSWHSFLMLGREEAFEPAAHLLDLAEVPPEQQTEVGEGVAKKLYAVVKALRLGPNSVTCDEPEGPDDHGVTADTVLVHSFRRAGLAGELRLHRVTDATTSAPVWLLAPQTVSSAGFWHELVVQRQVPAESGQLNAGLGPLPPEVTRGTPRQAMAGFLEATGAGRFAEAAHYMDLGGIDSSQQAPEGARLARQLMLVMVRAGLVHADALSDKPFGVPEEGLAHDQELVAALEPGPHRFLLVLQQHWSESQDPVWTFSSDTVAGIDYAYRESGFGRFLHSMPTFLIIHRFAGLQLWQWFVLLMVLVVGGAVAWGVGHWSALLLRAIAVRTKISWDDKLAATADGPLGLIVWALILAIAAPTVGLTPAILALTRLGWRLIALIGLAWLGSRLVDSLAGQLQEVGAGHTRVLSFAPLVRRVGRFSIAILFVFAALDIFGINVAAMLAGVGIGGVAIAFAAQKTLENVFGAATIAGDKPFAVGDFVQIGQLVGTVEGIGLRSVRVRTMERTLVTVPNSTVVASDVVNMSERDRMLYNPVIGVVYGTSADQLRFITDEVQRFLLSHPRVWPESLRCRLLGFGPSSLDIEILAWLETTEFHEFTALREEINYRVMEIVERSGTSIAVPSQSLHLARQSAPDPELGRAAEESVRRRTMAGELSVPEPPPELKERLLRERGREDAV